MYPMENSHTDKPEDATPAVAPTEDAPDSGLPEAAGAQSDARAVPHTRLSRFSRMVRIATGVAGGMIAEGSRQLAKGNRPRTSDLLLTPANARRVADQLAQLRGAAMKVGQLVSMDAGDLLPKELTDILARLRSDAHAMPAKQLEAQLCENWGEDWQRRVYSFSSRPVAAASIGQVHEAISLRGKRLAIKIQYPGVRRSIDSDVDNVASLLRISRLLPSRIDIKPLLQEAKRQLHEEADYLAEAAHLVNFRQLLRDAPQFVVPEVDEELTTESILAMSFVEGHPIESLEGSARRTRDRAVSLLMELFFRELFEFQLVQTDPNFANYRYCYQSKRLVLLDFGATRAYSREFARSYRKLFRAVVNADRDLAFEAGRAIGYFQDHVTAEQAELLLDIIMMAGEPFQCDGPYDFGASHLGTRLNEAAMVLSRDRDYWHTPPADALFLHRKLGGLFLLAARLEARADVRELVAPHL